MVAEPRTPRNAKTKAKRERIVDSAMRQFAEHGYQGAKVEDIAVRARHREGLDLPALRVEGRAVPAGVQARGAHAARLARRARRGAGRGLLRHGALLARAHRAPHQGRLDPQPRRADRQLRHRPHAEARDQPVARERGPLRHPRVRGMGPATRRGARRRRPGDHRVDGRLARRTRCRTRSSPRSSTRACSTGSRTSPSVSACAWSTSRCCSSRRSAPPSVRVTDGSPAG